MVSQVIAIKYSCNLSLVKRPNAPMFPQLRGPST